MANYMIRFRESSGDIQYHQWDILDNTTAQKYDFTMSDFDKYDQWVHLVGSFFSMKMLSSVFIGRLQIIGKGSSIPVPCRVSMNLFFQIFTFAVPGMYTSLSCFESYI